MSLDHNKIELIMRLRAEGVRDTRVLEAIEKVPRESFLPDHLQDQAYADHALPIECGQTISQPFLVGLMTHQLNLTDRTKVLEVGTGSGYQAAVLSHVCRRVYTIERFHSLAKQADERFRQLARRNITTMTGDGTKGWPAQAPFERIIVTAAAMDKVPPALIEQLAVGGEMIIPVEYAPGRQELRRIVRTDEGFETERLLPVRFVPLIEGVAKDA
ncbi:MAG: protein-L-isoaspartate(D-aspartate) O-methyltransferase [Rhizobiales bacterium]|nr:protein-L-isoaspartate(D-aspartate) O-methyltransferase [Hyphomicrobiales bacterium]